MNETTIRTMTSVLLSAVILVLSIGFLVLEKQEFSENENRYLEPFPALKWETVKSGEYMKGLNAYLCDHFPLRDFFVSLKANAETAIGKKEINQVYLCSDGYLIEEYKRPKNTEQISRIMQSFSQKEELQQVDLHLMLIPTAVYAYQDKLPKFAPARNQMDTANQIYQMSNIPAIDCSQDLLAHKEESPLYYRTDHHWTTFGAYIGYLAFCREKGLTPVSLEALEAETAADGFCGTIYSKVKDYSQKGDPIILYRNPADKLTVFYEDTKETSDSLYNLEYTKKKDKYSLFLNNLHPLVEITNETAESERELVLIKDSYANSMVPFLVRHFKKIYVLDTRYYKLGPSGFIKSHESVTDVLILYNMNTLDDDLGIRAIY
ncbi:hypothetical protein D3Z51_10050 [Clostridiaceae bacterium]|nr:hypothetical protein [Clostridiaceae bacterium]RKI13808.1 hypothetical protein D7V81_09535 [bacterium 1XD21-70]